MASKHEMAKLGNAFRAAGGACPRFLGRWCCWAACAAFALPTAARAEITVSLQVAQSQPAGQVPYRSAELAIHNGSDKILRAVSIRWWEGGPTILQPLTLPPQASRSLTVQLPAISQQQTYLVQPLLQDRLTAPSLATIEAAIQWPADLVTAEEFFDPGIYQRLDPQPPAWPRELCTAVFLAAALGGLAMAACLFIRRPWLRVLAILVVTAGTAAALGWRLARQPIVVARLVPSQGLLEVGCRRSTDWTFAGQALAPIYRDQGQMQRETMVIHPGRDIEVRLHPWEVRLFRLTETTTAPAE